MFYRQNGDVISAKFGANDIKIGQIVTVDAAGNAKAGEAGKDFLGIALENTADVIRGNEVRICTEGVFELGKDSAVATDLGKGVKIVDADKVAVVSASADVKIGQIVGIVNESKVLVKIK